MKHDNHFSENIKEKYTKSFFKENKRDSKKVWESIRSIMNLKNGEFSINISLNIDNEIITDNLSQINLITSIQLLKILLQKDQKH